MDPFDKNIKDKLSNRVIMPSSSAWERLEDKLNEIPQKKNNKWLPFIRIAASILLIITIGVLFFDKDNLNIKPKENTANADTFKEIKKVNNLIEKKENPEKVIVNVKIIKTDTLIKEYKRKEIEAPSLVPDNIVIKKAETIEKKDQIHQETKKELKEGIKIKGDDLLYAVTHSQSDVDEYYAEHKISREKVLNTIKLELEKTKINIDPETVLAEVERNITNEEFQNNFMKSLKQKVSDIALAFVNRNE